MKNRKYMAISCSKENLDKVRFIKFNKNYKTYDDVLTTLLRIYEARLETEETEERE